MVREKGRTGGKRPKTAAEPEQSPKQRHPIEGLDEFRRLEASWPADMADVFAEGEAVMPQVSTLQNSTSP